MNNFIKGWRENNQDFSFHKPRRLWSVWVFAVLIVILTVLIFIFLAVGNSLGGYAEYMVKTPSQTHHKPQGEVLRQETGIASWYRYELSEGDNWSDNHYTAASRDLPRYSYAKITNIENGKSVVIFINDFGPEEWTGRQIDLSNKAFSELADLKIGLIKVRIEPLKN